MKKTTYMLVAACLAGPLVLARAQGVAAPAAAAATTSASAAAGQAQRAPASVAASIAQPQRLAAAEPAAATQPTPAAAQAQQPPAPAARGPSLQLALEAAQKAVETCKGLDQKIGVTVIDSAGVFKVVLATDGASTRGVQSSTNKALTTLAFGAATSELGEKIKTDTALAEKIAANTNYNTHAGGLLIKVGNDVIGAIGVGGAKGSEKDEACAAAGLAKVQGKLK